jgi:hypothetical protein
MSITINKLATLRSRATIIVPLHIVTAVTLGACIIHQVGCTPSYQQETAAARGTVVLDGKPLSAGSVLLVPTQGRSAAGPLGSDGTFILGTYSKVDGAIVGKHKVAILPLVAGPEGGLPPGFVPVPARYQSAEASGLEVDVKANEENVFDFQLSSSDRSDS